MQNKGAITFLAVVLLLASFYELWFTKVARSVEQNAIEYANGDAKKEKFYLDSISSEEVYTFLGFLKSFTYKEIKDREISLGLDLKGGMNVTLEIATTDLLKNLASNPQDTLFLRTIAKTKEKQRNSQKDFLDLFKEAFEEIAPGQRLSQFYYSNIDLKDDIKFKSTNDEVIDVLKGFSDAAFQNSVNVLRNRIDKFGVKQPTIQVLSGTKRILLELPGIKDPERAKKLLQTTANLEFWETYNYKDVFQKIELANKKIAEVLKREKREKIKIDKVDTNKTNNDNIDFLNNLAEEDTSSKSKEENLLTKKEKNKKEDTKKEFNENNPLYSVMQPNVTREGQPLSGPVVGLVHYKDTPTVNKYFNYAEVRKLLPKKLQLKWSSKPYQNPQTGEFTDFYEFIALKSTNKGLPALDGSVVTRAMSMSAQDGSGFEVSMNMNDDGRIIWKNITKTAAGNPDDDNDNASVAIVLDNYVFSHPRVSGEIAGGRTSITGNFSQEEASDLANVLKSGKLPAPARIIEETIVGPSLGKAAINSGINSFLIAFVLVLLYMLFYYSRAGIAANIALFVNFVLILGVLVAIGATLTLPGIAGIILTIGISVDANVLIYERIREEVLNGKGLKLAIKDGYNNAYSAIIDANVTTGLTAIILLLFGTGPIKGFATTLLIGILTSLFSAIFITRIVFSYFMEKKWKITFDTKLTRNAFKKMNFDFIGKSKTFKIISLIIIVASLGSLFTRGLDYGVDFTGGRSYEVKFDKAVSTVDVQKALKPLFGNNAPEVKTSGGSDNVRITTKYLINSEAENTDSIIQAKLFTGLSKFYKKKITVDEFSIKTESKVGIQYAQEVGPTIADDIKVSALWSIIFALLIIFLYIFIRFRAWQYGLGAVAALFHDVIIVLGVFSALYGFLPFSIEINQAFIAAILTVVGYSINDTVVIFDRIREYHKDYHKKKTFKEIVNSALNSTMSRTFSTSLSTFVVLLAVFIFGGETIRGFVFGLLIGVIVGTYSSLFIASSVTYDTMAKKLGQKK